MRKNQTFSLRSCLALSCCLAWGGGLASCSDESPPAQGGPSGSSSSGAGGSGSSAGGSNAGSSTSSTSSSAAGSTGSSTVSGAGAGGTTASGGGAGGEGGGRDGGSGGNGGTGGTAGAGGAMDSGLGGAAGSKDAGATDAPVGVDGAPPDGCGTALLCDNFDSYAAPGAPGGMWRVETQNGGTAAVDTTRAYSGTKAVHVMVSGTQSSQTAFIGVRGAPLFPLAKNIIFGRMMVYITRAPTTTVHWSFVQAQGSMVPGIPNATDAVYRYGAQRNGNQFLAQYDTVPSSDCAQRSTQVVPQNRWACIEWRFDGVLKELDLWVDGKIDPALSVRQRSNQAGACQVSSFPGIWEPPIFNSLSIGWRHYGAAGPGEMWIDDFAFDSNRVGCPAPP